MVTRTRPRWMFRAHFSASGLSTSRARADLSTSHVVTTRHRPSPQAASGRCTSPQFAPRIRASPRQTCWSVPAAVLVASIRLVRSLHSLPWHQSRKPRPRERLESRYRSWTDDIYRYHSCQPSVAQRQRHLPPPAMRLIQNMILNQPACSALVRWRRVGGWLRGSTCRWGRGRGRNQR